MKMTIRFTWLVTLPAFILTTFAGVALDSAHGQAAGWGSDRPPSELAELLDAAIPLPDAPAPGTSSRRREATENSRVYRTNWQQTEAAPPPPNRPPAAGKGKAMQTAGETKGKSKRESKFDVALKRSQEPILEELPQQTPPPITGEPYATEHNGCDGCGGLGCCTKTCCPDPCDPCDPCDRWTCGVERDRFCGWCRYNPWRNWHWAQDLTLFTGPHGFEGPLDFGTNGNFGYHYGMNWSFPFPIWSCLGVGGQVGAQVLTSNFSGDLVTAVNDEDRNQTYVTGGLFHRGQCHPWAFGVVYDYLDDDYYNNFEFGQVRAEISRRFGCRNELGAWIAAGVDEDDEDVLINNQLFRTEVRDQYVFFWRHYFPTGGEVRYWGGVTDDNDGIFGGDFYVPLSCKWGLSGDFNYVHPEEGTGADGVMNEAWYVGFQFVWVPSGNAQCLRKSPYRPLFNVANSGTFLTRFRD